MTPVALRVKGTADYGFLKKISKFNNMIQESAMLQKDVLVVDDDSIANFLIERIVQSTGLARNISKALNGREALEVIKSRHEDPGSFPDVILLDLNMPLMNGFEFIKAYRELEIDGTDEVLIILVTSSNDPSDIQRAKDLGIKYYLTKPLSADAIKGIFRTEFQN